MKQRFLTAFPALRYRNYQIFFMAQIVSQTGSWMQRVAQGYLVFQMTNSAFWVGAIDALSNLPTTFLSLIGGTIVDRFPKKKILRITQALQFVIASILGLMVISGHINLLSLGIMVFILGLVNAVDQPARLSLPIELVEREYLHSATALNMSIFNSARIIGPAIAGWLIFAVGIGWAFLLNGFSFLAPFIAFNFIKFAPFVKRPHFGTWHSIKEGVNYAFHHRLIRFMLFYMAMIGIFGWSYTTMLPVIAANVFHQDASGLGMLFSAAGAGTVLGAITVSALVSRQGNASSAYSRKFSAHKLILFGGLIFSTSLYLFTLQEFYPLALMLLFITGFGMAYQNSTLQATIQHRVHDDFRGRISSIQSMMMVGMTPIGSFQVGLVAEHFGPQLAVGIGALVMFISALLLYWKSPKPTIQSA